MHKKEYYFVGQIVECVEEIIKDIFRGKLKTLGLRLSN